MSLHQDPAQTHPWLSAEQGILTAQGQGPWNHGITVIRAGKDLQNHKIQPHIEYPLAVKA